MPKLPKKSKHHHEEKHEEKHEAVAEPAQPAAEAIAEAPPSAEALPEALPPPEAPAPLPASLMPAAKPKLWTVLERTQFSYKGQILHLVPGSVLNEHHYDKDFFESLRTLGVKLKEVL
jgi:hypothetical protein